MKLNKSIFLTAILMPFASYAQNAATSAAAVVAALPAAEQAQDRSYVKDFASAKPLINLKEESTNRSRGLIFQKFESVGGVRHFSFSNADGSAGEFFVPMKNKFAFSVQRSQNFARGTAAYNSGNYGDAVAYWREGIYPYIPLLELPASTTLSIHSDTEKFIDALIKTKKYKEAAALAAEIPFTSVPPSLVFAGIKLAREFAQNGLNEDAAVIMQKIVFTKENEDCIPEFMALLADLRKRGQIKEALLWYTKLSNMETNPQKSKALIWMVYCDIQEGNTVSAQVYLSQIGEVPTTDEYFSLMQMVKGMFKSAEGKPAEALDLFAEGIVYSDMSEDWMPELLFRAGMGYKGLKDLTASNEIFKQLLLFYPDDIFAVKAKEQIVEVPAVPANQQPQASTAAAN